MRVDKLCNNKSAMIKINNNYIKGYLYWSHNGKTGVNFKSNIKQQSNN